MKNWLVLLTLSFVATGLVACGGDTASTELPEVQGPALVLFYTDN